MPIFRFCRIRPLFRLGFVPCLAFGGISFIEGVQAQCNVSAANHVAAEVPCVSNAQVRILWDYFESAEPSEAPGREDLDQVVEMMRCLGDEIYFPVDFNGQRDFLCTIQSVLNFYLHLGDQHVKIEDLLARAPMAIRYAVLALENAPAAPETEWDVQRALSQGLLDYRTVFGSALRIKRAPSSYTGTYLADKLGIDNLLNPAPELSFLDGFIDLGVDASIRLTEKERPEAARQIGNVLGSTLCAGLELYPVEERGRLSWIHDVLIGFDAGNMAATAYIYRFASKFAELVGWSPPAATQVQPTAGAAPGPGASNSSAESAEAGCRPAIDEVHFPEFSRQGGQTIGLSGGWQSSLQSMKHDLQKGAKLLRNRSSAWRPFRSYGSLLHGMAENWRSSRQGGSSAVDQLIEESSDALYQGIELSLAHATSSQLREVRDQLFEQVNSQGEWLLQAVEFDQLADFVAKYIKNPDPDLVAGRNLEVLTDQQQQVLHVLLAKAHFMLGNTTQAGIHVRESQRKITFEELKKMKQEYQRQGIGIGIGK